MDLPSLVQVEPEDVGGRAAAEEVRALGVVTHVPARGGDPEVIIGAELGVDGDRPVVAQEGQLRVVLRQDLELHNLSKKCQSQKQKTYLLLDNLELDFTRPLWLQLILK